MHAAPASREPTTDEWTQYRRLCRQNVTCFTLMEESHPINFYEQRDVCSECGCERFSTSSHKQCCQSGALVLVRKMPASLLSLISESPGLSKQSRAANDLFRLAQMALPKGTHRIPDMYQHLKVTGVPFAIVPNLNERSSTRSFLDDPYERLEARNKFDSSTRPSDRAIAIIEAVLTRENSLVRVRLSFPCHLVHVDTGNVRRIFGQRCAEPAEALVEIRKRGTSAARHKVTGSGHQTVVVKDLSERKPLVQIVRDERSYL